MALIAVSFMNYSTGAVPSLTAAAASDTFAMPSSSGQRFAIYKNTNAAARTVTVDIPTSLDDQFGRDVSDLLGTANNLAATTGELWIPLHPDMADSTGVITITVSATTNVTVGHIQIA